MSASYKKEKRNVIPRWRLSRNARKFNELGSVSINTDSDIPMESTFDSLQIDFNEHRTIWHAFDLVSSAIVLNRLPEVETAINFISDNKQNEPISSSFIKVLKETNEEDISTAKSNDRPEILQIRLRISKCKKILSDDPYNSLAWIDLAFNYTLLGVTDKARRAIEVALRLNSTNRFILRSASRFYIHSGDLEKAYQVVAQSDSTIHDPWLISAAIAAAGAGNRKTRFLDNARSMLRLNNFSPFDLSELHSELGTHELTSGKHNAAKKLFNNSLISATENSLAQAQWAASQITSLKNVVNTSTVPFSYEAFTLNSFNNSSWDDAIVNASLWYEDQPFSSRPAIMLSYLYSIIFDKYDEAISIIERSLRANQNNQNLLNNLAYSYACQGNIVKASETIEKVDLDNISERDKIYILATKGLIEYRRMNIDLGRRFYSNAMEIANKESAIDAYSSALLYMAREELRIHATDAEEAFQKISKRIENINDPAIKFLNNKIKDELKK